MVALYKAGIRDIPQGIKICARGSESLKQPLIIFANTFSQPAIQAIESKGGKAVAFHYTTLGLRALFRPASFDRLPLFAAPTSEKDQLYYFSYKNRGYLNPTILRELVEKYPQYFDITRYSLIKPREDQSVE